ncbi:hypothetical protein EMIT0P228_110200 [Pseudomonas brassicacearum]
MSGSTTWTRTRDPVINSHLLYQLSYRGMARMLLIGKEKSSVHCRTAHSWCPLTVNQRLAVTARAGEDYHGRPEVAGCTAGHSPTLRYSP